MNKRLATVVMAMVLAFGMLCACDDEEETAGTENVSVISETEEASSEESEAYMANPMVEYPDDSAFADELGIAIDSSYLPGEKQFFIIGKKLADIRFSVSDPEGRDVECVFRATKDNEDAKNPVEGIAGIYATDLDEAVDLEIPVDDGEIAFYTTYSESGNLNIAYWDYKDVHYTFTAGGGLSQMTLGALYDQLMCAIGACSMENGGKYIEPMGQIIDEFFIEDAMYPASVENITNEDGVVTADCTLYTMDVYDMVDIAQLAVGDTIFVDGEEMVVNTIEEGDPVDFHDEEGKRNVVIINGDIEEGGARFIAYEGGTYRYFGMDDYASYTNHGTRNLVISPEVQFVDGSNLELPEGTVLNMDDFLAILEKEYDPGFHMMNTVIRIVDNEVVEINRRYVP